jgi:hypothetical protein
MNSRVCGSWPCNNAEGYLDGAHSESMVLGAHARRCQLQSSATSRVREKSVTSPLAFLISRYFHIPPHVTAISRKGRPTHQLHSTRKKSLSLCSWFGGSR